MMLRESRDKKISNNPPDVKSARKWKAEEATNDVIYFLKAWIYCWALLQRHRHTIIFRDLAG